MQVSSGEYSRCVQSEFANMRVSHRNSTSMKWSPYTSWTTAYLPLLGANLATVASGKLGRVLSYSKRWLSPSTFNQKKFTFVSAWTSRRRGGDSCTLVSVFQTLGFCFLPAGALPCFDSSAVYSGKFFGMYYCYYVLCEFTVTVAQLVACLMLWSWPVFECISDADYSPIY